MTECQNVRGKWGEKCKSCGQIMRAGKPVQSWMAVKYAGSQRHFDMAIALRDNGRVQKFRLHRNDRRAA
jgi:hypothetical protein